MQGKAMTWLGGMVTVLVVAGGCSHDRPDRYGEMRPPIDEIDRRDSGLQSKDVVQASDQMAQDLLADEQLNRSHTRWTIVVDRVENRTVNSRFDLDVLPAAR